MEQKGSLLKSSLNYGLITGIAMIVFSLLVWMLDAMFVTGINMVSYLILAGGIFLGTKAFRDNVQGGFMSYGQGLGVGTLIALVAAVLSGVFSMIMMKYIDPDLIDKMMAVTEEQMLKNNVPEEQMQAGLEMSRKMMSFAWIIAIFTTTLIGFIISLIVSAILKKNQEQDVV